MGGARLRVFLGVLDSRFWGVFSVGGGGGGGVHRIFDSGVCPVLDSGLSGFRLRGLDS